MRLEAGDRVTVRYRPASSMPLNNGEPLEVPDALHAQLGELHILSRPAVVARLLSEALSECFAMWGDGHQDGPGDNPDDLARLGQIGWPLSSIICRVVPWVAAGSQQRFRWWLG